MKKFRKALIAVLSIVAVIAATMGLVACKKEKKYQLTFANTELAAVSVEDGKTFTLPTGLTKDGFEFEGWYLDASLSGNGVTEVKVTADTTVYAKWTQLYTISLELSGGNLSKTSLTVKKGENVYNAVINLKPTKTGYEFIGWYNGNSSLGTGVKADKDLTLTAKYGVGYDVEIWAQNTTLDGYELAETRHFVKDLGNKESVTVSANETAEGFTGTKNDNEVLSATLKAGEAKVVLKQYFDRNEYTLTYNSNIEKYSSSSKNSEVVENGYYGINMTVAADIFTLDGYYLEGWAETVDGEIKYNTAFIENHLYEKDGSGKEADKIALERNTVLYAVWSKGYTDVFGSDDTLFLSSSDDKAVYLYRGGIFFKGTLVKGDGKTDDRFTFRSPETNEILKTGSIYKDGTFIYRDNERGTTEYYLFKGGSLTSRERLRFGSLNDVEYTYYGQDGTVENTSRGTFEKDDDGYYTVTFTSGNLENKTIVLIVTQARDSRNNYYNIFIVRDESEIALGKIYQAGISDGQYITGSNYFELNGFGTATFTTSTQSANYSYSYSAEKSLLSVTASSSTLTFKVIDVNGKKAYISYDEDYDVAYTFTNGDTLTLDGIGFAVYNKGGVEKEGTYSVSATPLGEFIKVTSGKEVYNILITVKTEIVLGEDGKNVEKTVYIPELKPDGYKAFFFKDEKSIYYAPAIVIGDGEENEAFIYSYTSEGEAVKTLKARYEYNEATGLYTLTDIVDLNYEWKNGITDVSKITAEEFKNYKTVVFYGDSSTYSADIWYIDSTTDGEGVVVDNKVVYEAGDKKLVLVNGIAFYTENGTVHNGTYTKGTAYTTVTYDSGTIYVELDDEQHTFNVLDYKPYNARLYKQDGTNDKNAVLKFDGKGGATYQITVPATESGKEDEVISISGSISELADTTIGAGAKAYQFTPSDEVNKSYGFAYILLSSSSATYFAKYDEELNGRFTSSDSSELLIDGYAYYAKYTAADGNTYESRYLVTEINGGKVIAIAINGVTRYLDIKSDKTFTLRGAEYGTYDVLKNSNEQGYFVEFDGYGVAKVFKFVTDEQGESIREYIDENATYTLKGSVNVIVNYRSGEDEVTLTAERNTMIMTSGGQQYSIRVLVVVNEQKFVTTFVDASNIDVLVLDKYGNAVRYDKDGKKTTGSYVIITGTTDDEGNTKGLLYFTDGSKASTFTYDTATHTIVQTSNVNEGYYTSDFESLLFSEYGICIIDSGRYYYEVVKETVDGEVKNNYYIYKYDSTSKEANEYGFVKTLFGEMGETKEYDGKTYYKNDGFELSFTRTGNTDDYGITVGNIKMAPSSLTFRPTGNAEFITTGTVTFGSSSTLYSCYIERKKDSDGNLKTYIEIVDGVYGTYYYQIDIAYAGSDSATYEVKGLSYEVEADTQLFLNNQLVMLIYMLTGQMPENTLASLSMKITYAADGSVASSIVNGKLGEIGYYDFNGETVSIENATAVRNGSYSGYPMYYTELTSKDGYTYRLYYILLANSTFGRTMFYNYGFVRCEEKAYENYTLYTERVIASDLLSAGSYVNVKFKQGEETYKMGLGSSVNGNVLTFVTRATENGGEYIKNVKTVYYRVTITEKALESENDKVKVLPIESVSVVKLDNVVTYQNASAKNVIFADIANGEVLYLYYNGEALSIKEQSYNAENNEYTVVVLVNKKEVTYIINETDKGIAFLTRKATSGTETDEISVLAADNYRMTLSNGKYIVTDGEKVYTVDTSKVITDVTGLPLVKGDGDVFVVISEDGANVLFFTTDGNTVYKPSTTVKNSEGNYTVSYDTTVSGNKVTKTYTVVITEGKVTITEVTEA